MPIYEFECQKCGHLFETIVPSSSSPFPPCESCNSKRIKKAISRFGFSSGGKSVGSLGGSSGCSSCTASSCSSCN